MRMYMTRAQGFESSILLMIHRVHRIPGTTANE